VDVLGPVAIEPEEAPLQVSFLLDQFLVQSNATFTSLFNLALLALDLLESFAGSLKNHNTPV
jgi:hypothetical protein